MEFRWEFDGVSTWQGFCMGLDGTEALCGKVVACFLSDGSAEFRAYSDAGEPWGQPRDSLIGAVFNVTYLGVD
jgi:hypothetical protein